jgi:hypothetical protein
MIPVAYLPRPKIAFRRAREGVIACTLEARPGINLSASKTITIIRPNDAYSQAFSNTSSFLVLATTHGLAKVKGVTLLDDQHIEMLADVTINRTTQNVSVNFRVNQTGTLIIF